MTDKEFEVGIRDTDLHNFVLEMGEGTGTFQFNFQVSKTAINRVKYWLFCKFFPFRVVRWE